MEPILFIVFGTSILMSIICFIEDNRKISLSLFLLAITTFSLFFMCLNSDFIIDENQAVTFQAPSKIEIEEGGVFFIELKEGVCIRNTYVSTIPFSVREKYVFKIIGEAKIIKGMMMDE